MSRDRRFIVVERRGGHHDGRGKTEQFEGDSYEELIRKLAAKAGVTAEDVEDLLGPREGREM